MLLEVVLALEGLAAHLAGEGDVVLVTALVDHQVVGLGEATLTVLAHKLALGPHLAPELCPPVVTLYLHNREHVDSCVVLVFTTLCTSSPGTNTHSSSTQDTPATLPSYSHSYF